MMQLIKCTRGSASMTLAITLIPLIGAIALGGEAGSWYVTKQHAQNAADSSSLSGMLNLACTLAGSCPDTQNLTYRAKEFAAQNGFCNSGDASVYPESKCKTLPLGVSQKVTITQLTAWNGVSGNYVQSSVQQIQPTSLARILGLKTITITASAVAVVNSAPKPPCVLALTSNISFQGSANINAPNCGMGSNSKASNALDFTTAGTSMSFGSLTAAGGCTGSTSYCQTARTYRTAITNPFKALDSVTLPTLSNCTGSTLVAYTAAKPCQNNNYTLNGNTDVTLAGGVYFISGKIKINGNASILGTALFIFLPGADFNMVGTGKINITGNASVSASQLPAALQGNIPGTTTSYASLLAYMSLYDRSTNPIIIGNTTQFISLKGNLYAPSASVTFQGDHRATTSGGTCGQIIASSVVFNGNSTFDSSGCASNTTPIVQYVSLVQ